MSARLVRIVALRRGKLSAAEFRIRPGENGLSLFELVREADLNDIIQAVRLAGKQGNLAAALIQGADFKSLGLNVVSTPGGTPDEDVNLLHREARLPLLRRAVIRLQGHKPLDYFNETIAPRLYGLSSVFGALNEE